ncbi:hypothetical protein EPR50_G00172580 [Perca flavescens]|uniref:Dual specificity protein phosphatase 26 n=1 Tax=Perca flavescens TaxID=8167 RepID=A0A484CK70_PERFV|nr:hypothetical protein EPR50_G00172580 [Perca flavescens]
MYGRQSRWGKQVSLRAWIQVLVHCTVGVSRSATLVLAYLMIRQNLTLVEAIKTVKDHRGVIPNRGFLRQLNGLDGILRESRKTSPHS